MDSLEKATSVDLNWTRLTHLSIYERFLNDSCGVSFCWYLSSDKKLEWRDMFQEFLGSKQYCCP